MLSYHLQIPSLQNLDIHTDDVLIEIARAPRSGSRPVSGGKITYLPDFEVYVTAFYDQDEIFYFEAFDMKTNLSVSTYSIGIPYQQLTIYLYSSISYGYIGSNEFVIIYNSCQNPDCHLRWRFVKYTATGFMISDSPLAAFNDHIITSNFSSPYFYGNIVSTKIHFLTAGRICNPVETLVVNAWFEVK